MAENISLFTMFIGVIDLSFKLNVYAIYIYMFSAHIYAMIIVVFHILCPEAGVNMLYFC